MHLLSTRNQSEFLACPQLVRFAMAEGGGGREATLLIKSTTLSLKYLVRLERFRLLLFPVRGTWLAYGVQIDDDPTSPAVLWSLVQDEEELEAIRALTSSPKCVVFLFNELAVNVAWTQVAIDLSADQYRRWLQSATAYPRHAHEYPDEVTQSLEALSRGELAQSDGRTLEVSDISGWKPISAQYIANSASGVSLSIFETDEGQQQEELALWLIDNLKPAGAVKNPQIHEESKPRELSDLLLSHDYGTFLIESKTLSILSRPTLPDRERLSRNIRKHVEKAVSQLIGGAKNLRRGLRITDIRGQEVAVERTLPPHLIVLVPELSLLDQAQEFGGRFIAEVNRLSGGLLHILDPAELLRVVQAAQVIAAQAVATQPVATEGTQATLLMAFDYYLLERSQLALKTATPHFEVLFRVGATDVSNEGTS